MTAARLVGGSKVTVMKDYRMMQTKYAKFLPRLVKFRHLELDSAFQQVLWAVTNPKRLFRYHQDQNAMRGYWARDDPAFLLLLLLFMAVSVIGFGVWLRLHVGGFFLGWLWTLLIDVLLTSSAIASLLWLVANNVLREKSSALSKPVEWAYCFDVHINAFVPLALFVYGLQMLFLPLLASSSIISTMVSNSLWLLSICYYVYITFLGYSVLPSMRMHSTMLLYAVVPLVVIYIISIPLKWNMATTFKTFYRWKCAAH